MVGTTLIFGHPGKISAAFNNAVFERLAGVEDGGISMCGGKPEKISVSSCRIFSGSFAIDWRIRRRCRCRRTLPGPGEGTGARLACKMPAI